MYKVSNLAQEYKKKLITADQAAAMVQNGDRLHFGDCQESKRTSGYHGNKHSYGKRETV